MVTPRTVGDRETLVAHVIADERVISPADVRRHMSERHGAAAPRMIVFVEVLPRSAHGKLDRRAAAMLPLPITEPDERTDSFVAIWRRAIGDPTLGADDDFFTSGGDSLAAAQIVAAVSELTGREVPIGLLLRARTPRALAAELEVRLAEDDGHSPISTVRAGAADGPVILVITPPTSALDPTFDGGLPTDAAVLAARLDDASRTVDEVAEDLTSALVEAYRGRRLILVGWKSGGLVAHEVGRRLSASDFDRVRVALIDTDLPGSGDAQSADSSFSDRVRATPEEGRRLARRYGARLQRAGSALRGKQIRPAEGEDGDRATAFAGVHVPVTSGRPVLLFTSPGTSSEGLQAAWRRVEPDVVVVETDHPPGQSAGAVATHLAGWLRSGT
ncbi:MAG: phosphopantetheine-binding protein [Acidimicrobiia bacterium]|nr:phosphopantetheine-binding protein [Acidimicrobiia bacterium]